VGSIVFVLSSPCEAVSFFLCLSGSSGSKFSGSIILSLLLNGKELFSLSELLDGIVKGTSEGFPLSGELFKEVSEVNFSLGFSFSIVFNRLDEGLSEFKDLSVDGFELFR